MFAPYMTRSKSLEMIEEESSEDGLAHKVTFRVTDLTAWNSQLVDVLKFAEDEEDYVLSVRKEYYVLDGAPRFVWNMMIWGDYASAARDLGPLMQIVPQRASPPAPAEKAAAPAAQRGRASILAVRKIGVEDDGTTRVVKKVRLPHRRGNRDNPGEGITKKMGDKRMGAYVSTASGAI